MELEFTDEQLELRDNVRDVLEGQCPRSLRQTRLPPGNWRQKQTS